MGANGRSFARQRPLARDQFLLMLNTPVDTPDDQEPLEFSVEVVEEFLDYESLERPVLLGSSFGGTCATLVALRRPERLRALVLVSAPLARWMIPLAFPGFVDVLEAPTPLAALMSPLAAEVMGGFALDRDARNEVVREARHFHGAELKRRLHSLLHLDLLPRLSELRVPVLWVHGSRDLLVPWRRGRKAAELIPGARFELIKGAGHLPYLSHPEPFNALVTEFLGSLR
jgi:pimeloyl-ACP methyl ester carboxylesterase